MKTCQDIIEKRRELWNIYGSIKEDKKYLDCVVEYILHPDNNHIRDELIQYPEKLIEMTFTIVDKETKTVPFFLNEEQKDFEKLINQAVIDYKDGKRNSLLFIILKARQLGFTSYITARQLAYTITRSNFSGFTIADIADNARDIFQDKAKTPYDNLPDALKPSEKYNSRNELYFDKLNSKWRVSTAENKNVGRSKTLNFCHMSEVAFWKNIRVIITGLGEALTKEAIQIIETTANGYNEFKTLWDEAVRGENDWQPIFYPWYGNPDYRHDFESQDKELEFKANVINAKEGFFRKLKNMKAGLKLDWQQLYWYYLKYKKLGANVSQEHPSTPEEAFLHSGRPYFDLEILDNLLLIADQYKPKKTERGGQLVIFEEPVKNRHYIIGADVAEGLEDGDSSHACIFDAKTWKEMGFFHGTIEPNEFGDILTELAIRYNNAYIAPERNNHGHAVCAKIFKENKYKNIHVETKIEHKTDKKTTRYGWYTSEKSKYLMLDELNDAIKNDLITIKDIETLKELREVVINNDGKVFINGKDRVAAKAIAWQMRKHYKPSVSTKKVIQIKVW